MRLIALFSTAVAATAVVMDDQPNKVIAGRADPKQTPAQTPLPNALTSHGCFSALGDALEDPGDYDVTRVSSGFCFTEACKDAKVFALKGSSCYCGDKYPPKDSLVDDSNCNYGCPSYPLEACGGIGGGSFYSVFNTGKEVDIKYADPESTSTTGSTDTPSSTSAPIETVTQSSEPKKSTNVGGIAAGVVVGLLAVCGVVGGAFFYMRRKRNQRIEEEHRRNAAVNSFMGHKPPGSSGGLSITDSRLDPVMAQRRLSDGSIADNQDYSRKILRVTNA